MDAFFFSIHKVNKAFPHIIIIFCLYLPLSSLSSFSWQQKQAMMMMMMRRMMTAHTTAMMRRMTPSDNPLVIIASVKSIMQDCLCPTLFFTWHNYVPIIHNIDNAFIIFPPTSTFSHQFKPDFTFKSLLSSLPIKCYLVLLPPKLDILKTNNFFDNLSFKLQHYKPLDLPLLSKGELFPPPQ